MRDLKQEINSAIAWGVPDRDSIGYSHGALTKLLSVVLKRINYLEETLRDNKIVFTETDWIRREHIREI